MNKKTIEKLMKLGWDEDWVQNVAQNFNPKRKGKYKIEIFDIEEIDQDPESGLWIETAYFDNEAELSLIHYFFEGFGYIMTVSKTGERIGRGIIDGSPFDEAGEYESINWRWYDNSEIEELYKIKVMLPGVKAGDILFVSVANRFSGKVRLIHQEQNRIFVSVISACNQRKALTQVHDRDSVWIYKDELVKVR